VIQFSKVRELTFEDHGSQDLKTRFGRLNRQYPRRMAFWRSSMLFGRDPAANVLLSRRI